MSKKEKAMTNKRNDEFDNDPIVILARKFWAKYGSIVMVIFILVCAWLSCRVLYLIEQVNPIR